MLKERQDECEIWIMGSGLPEYESFLKSEVKKLGLKNVKFLGFVNGQEKYEKLSSRHQEMVKETIDAFLFQESHVAMAG